MICLDNHVYEASLEKWKVYSVIVDRKAEMDDLVRVVDESREDGDLEFGV